MSGQIAHAMEDAARKAEQGLAQDFTKAYHTILKDTEQKTKQAAEHAAENETKTVEDLGKSAEHGAHEPHEPHPGGGNPEPRPVPEREDSPCGRDQVRDPHDAGRGEDAVCPGGEPVDMATGRMFIDQVDALLPGTLPLEFTRCFESGYRVGRWMGPRWVCTFDERLEIDDEGVVHLGSDRRAQAYPHPEPGIAVEASAGPRRELNVQSGERCYTLTDPSTGLVKEFTVQVGGRAALLTKVRSRNGDHYVLTYDPDGTPQAVIHSGGYHLTVNVTDGRISELLLAGAAPDGSAQSLVRYGYTDGHLTEVYNSSGLPMRFANDPTGRILSWTDRNNSQYLYTYDNLDRVIDEGGADGTLRFRFTYGDPDPDTGLKFHTETNAFGHTTTYEINERCQVVAISDPLGHTTRYERDEYDRLLAETDPLGRTTRYEYDGAGDLIRMTRPDGEHSTAGYLDGLSLPTLVTDPGGVVWRQTYDNTGLRTSITDPMGAVTFYSHDELGHLSAVTDALGHTALVKCNAAGLPVETTDPMGATTRYERDAFGRTVKVTDPLGGVDRLTWTAEGRLASRLSADGSTQTWTYDGEGNLIAHTDQLGQVSTFEYTHFETLAARTGPDGARVEFTHDADMKLVAVTNALGQQWAYRYDAAGRLIGETDFQQRTVSYELDAADQVVAVTNPLGQQIRHEYDVLGRLTSRNAEGRVTAYGYDAAGHLVRAVNPDSDVQLTVDLLGLTLSETTNGRTLTHARDILGRRTHRTTPNGHTSAWTYDPVGRPTALVTADGSIDVAYDAMGREQHRGINDRIRLHSTWDSLHRLTGQSVRTRTQSVLQRRTYTYRADGHPTAVDDQLAGARSFELDAVGRVTAVQADNWTESYAYDPVGNLTNADWPATGATAAAVGARTHQGSQLTTAGRIRYEYDAAGRTVLRQVSRLSRKPDTWRYTWDAEDRLTQVTTPDGTVWRYLYDPFGRRTTKHRLAADGVTIEERTEFTWDGPVLAEQTTHAPYLPGPHTLSWDHKGIQPLAQTETVTSMPDPDQAKVDSRFFAIVTDLVGTPTELIDPTTDSVVWRATRTLWGHTTWPTTSATYTPLRFPGQYFDPESRLHYNVHRYYDPETARYTSPDPLGLIPAPNPDTYVHNPLTWVDPLGLSPHPEKEINWSPKSVKTFGHAFSLHGAGKKNTKGLIGRAAGTKKEQGQWLDDDAAAALFEQHWDPSNLEPRLIDIPPGLGHVIRPDGSIVPVTRAVIVPRKPGGIYKTGYPISENFDGNFDDLPI